MEATVAVALITALSTLGGALGGAFIANWWANKRFKQELERAREQDARQRHREVRSEPLLKLRNALAEMAARLQILVTNTQLPLNQPVTTEEKRQRALEDWRHYMTSGEFLPTLYLQYDEELRKQVEEIEAGYMLLFEYALDYENLRDEELKTFREISRNTKDKIPKVQELIYKRLEEL